MRCNRRPTIGTWRKRVAAINTSRKVCRDPNQIRVVACVIPHHANSAGAWIDRNGRLKLRAIAFRKVVRGRVVVDLNGGGPSDSTYVRHNTLSQANLGVDNGIAGNVQNRVRKSGIKLPSRTAERRGTVVQRLNASVVSNGNARRDSVGIRRNRKHVHRVGEEVFPCRDSHSTRDRTVRTKPRTNAARDVELDRIHKLRRLTRVYTRPVVAEIGDLQLPIAGHLRRRGTHHYRQGADSVGVPPALRAITTNVRERIKRIVDPPGCVVAEKCSENLIVGQT